MRLTHGHLVILLTLLAYRFISTHAGYDTVGQSSLTTPALNTLPRSAASHEPADVVTKGLLIKDGEFYHGVYPGHCKALNRGKLPEDCSALRDANPGACDRPDDESGEEDNITCADVLSYENKVGRLAAWVYFSNNWDAEADMRFPAETAKWIRGRGAVPFIRLMLRKSTNEVTERNHVEEVDNYVYNLDRILSTDRAVNADDKLMAWGADARKFGTPVIVEFGTEVNNKSHPWNGKWNGGEVGAHKFKKAYRHIVEVIRDKAGARNVIWVFHVDAVPDPDPEADGATWNTVGSYYPGKDYVDWLGLSVYGPQKTDEACEDFSSVMSKGYQELVAATADDPTKPIFVLEFGITGNHPTCHPGRWVGAALGELLEGRSWPRVRGFAWWNEVFENGRGEKPTTTRVQSHSRIRDAFRAQFSGENKGKIRERPRFVPSPPP